jgi:DNA invertase Pin-like site-specific DNA recombinase
MTTLIYIRVSTADQNPARQAAELSAWAEKTGAAPAQIEVISEAVSGSVPFEQRKAAKRIEQGGVVRLVVLSLDRLGRDAIDVQATIKGLTGLGINVTITALSLATLTPDGKPNPAATLALAVLAHVAEMERETLLEPQRQGIAQGKRSGKYKGRKKGTTESPDQIIAKYPRAARELRAGQSIRNTAAIAGISVATVQRVKAAMATID